MTSCQLYRSTCQSWAMQSLKSTPNLWRCTIRVAPATQEWSATTCGVDRESSNGPTVLGMKANIRRMPGMEKVWLMNQLYNIWYMYYSVTGFVGKANNTLHFHNQIHWKWSQFDPPICLFITGILKCSVYIVMSY